LYWIHHLEYQSGKIIKSINFHFETILETLEWKDRSGE